MDYKNFLLFASPPKEVIAARERLRVFLERASSRAMDARLIFTTLDVNGDGVVDLEVEIDAHTLHLKLARFTGQVAPSDAPNTVRVVTLSKFDEPVNIEAPVIP